jgi:hypothetical protein
VLGAFRLVFGSSIPSELAGLAVGAVVYLVTLRAMGLDAEERMVIDRVKARAFKNRGKSK